MSPSNVINKMGAEVLAQSIESPEISKNFSIGLKDKILKLGSSAVMVAAFAFSAGLSAPQAHADSALPYILGAGALVGAATNGSHPNGPDGTSGTNGWKVGGATVLGGVVGNQFGNGTGKVLMTVAGALVGGTLAQNSENQRMEEAAIQNGYRAPQWNGRVDLPKNNVLYEGVRANGGSYVVTVGDSIGIAALTGKRIGHIDVRSDELVYNAFDKAAMNLEASYSMLDAAANKYMTVVSGKTTTGKLSRYAVDDNEIRQGSQMVAEQQAKIAMAKAEFDRAYQNYATKRSVFANIADNAAADGYNITEFGKELQFFTPPQSAKMIDVNNNYGNSYNRYAVLPGAIKP